MRDAWQRTHTVIMAGGVGSRFWPASRAARPKQVLDLFGQGPMLRVTADRLAERVPPERQLVVTSEALADAVRELLPELPAGNVLAEPLGRNTAAAIGWAATEIRRRDPDALVAVLAADHHVVDVAGFLACAARALTAAAEGRIATIGIRPTRPETGYGYIRAGAPLAAGVHAVREFREKPDVETAAAFLASGEYLWNSGTFFLPVGLALDELTRFEPALAAALGRLDVSGGAPPELVRAVYPTLPSISIDYAVMERSDRVVVVPGDFGWSDVGSWRTLFDFRAPGAASFARGDVVELDGAGNVLFAVDGAVTTVGVSDLVVVHTRDATLVCPREAGQRVRELVERLGAAGLEDLL